MHLAVRILTRVCRNFLVRGDRSPTEVLTFSPGTHCIVGDGKRKQGKWKWEYKRDEKRERLKDSGRDGKRVWHKPLCRKGKPCISAFAYEIAYSAGTLFETCFPHRLFGREKKNSVMWRHESTRFFDDDLDLKGSASREYNYRTM